MFSIVTKRDLNKDISYFEIEAPKIAKKHKAGQFIVLRIDETGERIPVTIAGTDVQRGTITIIVQGIGKTTRHLNSLKQGDSIMDVVGPLGQATHIEKFGTAVVMGGGVGIAEAWPPSRLHRPRRAPGDVVALRGASRRLRLAQRPEDSLARA